MTKKLQVIRGILTLIAVFLLVSASAQTPMPSYYYANKKPGSLKGLRIEVAPYSKPLIGLEESYKPSFLDVTLAYSWQLVPGYHKATFAPEIALFFNYASYAAKEDTLIYPVLKSDQLVDYGKLALSNFTIYHGGAQIIFWNNTQEKLQIGPGIGVSVGRYSYDYYATAKPDSSLQSGEFDHEFVSFSPSLGAKYALNDNMRLSFNLVYNMIFETSGKSSELDHINPDFSKAYSVLAPKIGFTYIFKQK
ncbi:MAG: hypothetical protein V4616_13615 [Bacteroidota bacterium]